MDIAAQCCCSEVTAKKILVLLISIGLVELKKSKSGYRSLVVHDTNHTKWLYSNPAKEALIARDNDIVGKLLRKSEKADKLAAPAVHVTPVVMKRGIKFVMETRPTKRKLIVAFRQEEE